MANHKQTAKRARQTVVKTERNRFYKTRIKNITKSVVSAIEANDKEAAVVAMKTANKYLHHCVSKNILKLGTASRKVSRLQQRINSL
ncbi:MAG: 30S ribosomal protein S20 [Epsilonproteobacteria bacterium]|nr:30S ribosomal protein S20 [Campylobacterota bacterium]